LFFSGGKKVERERIREQHFALLSLYYYFSKPGSCFGIIIIIMVIKAPTAKRSGGEQETKHPAPRPTLLHLQAGNVEFLINSHTFNLWLIEK